MDWNYKLKRLLLGRYTLTAVAFLLVMTWGAVQVAAGLLDMGSACKGYASPHTEKHIVKTDPTAPHRLTAAAPTTLRGEAEVPTLAQQMGEKTAEAETAVNKALDREHHLIQIFGAFQDFSDRTVVEDAAGESYAVSKLPNGALTFVGQGDPDPREEAAELLRLKHSLDGLNIPLLYVQAPSKLPPEGATGLPYGMTDTGNACADRLLEALEETGVDYIDLRTDFLETGKDWGEWFYATDHHWNQDAAFLAFQKIGGKLGDYYMTSPSGRGVKREKISIDRRYFDPELYEKETLPDYFLGSQGKRVGSLYAGADDFTLWTPKFPTLLHYTAPGYNIDRYGDAQETVLFPQRVEERDWFEGNPYTYYSGGDYAYARVWNYYNSTGPRVLLVRESFACALTPYLAYSCSEVTTVDPRYFNGDLMSYVNLTRPDVVIVMYSAGTTRSPDNFRFCRRAVSGGKGEAIRWLPEGET